MYNLKSEHQCNPLRLKKDLVVQRLNFNNLFLKEFNQIHLYYHGG